MKLSNRGYLPSFRASVWVFLFFILTVFLLGGGSRSDLASLPFLRGLAAMLIGYGLLSLGPGDWRSVRVPVLLLAGAALWMIAQLVPLPHDWWAALPRREVIAKLDAMLGYPDLSRPISFAPSMTWNSLLSLTIPICALVLAGALTFAELRDALKYLIGIALISVAMGVLQKMGGAGSPAYLYRITNVDSMVGLFANRNHSATFLAAILVITAMFLRDEILKRKRKAMVVIGLGATIALFVTIILTTGSRAGLLVGGIAFLATHYMVWSAQRKQRGQAAPKARGARREPTALTIAKFAAPWLLLLFVAGLFLASNQMNSLSRLADLSVAADMRTQAGPIVLKMADRFWLLGSGFGSFRWVFLMFEPDAMLGVQYFNNAHNDWLELLITGGVPAVLLLVAGLVWTVLQFRGHGGWRTLDRRGDVRLPIAVILLIFAIASIVDYPLRVPSLQAFVAILLVLLVKFRVSTGSAE